MDELLPYIGKLEAKYEWSNPVRFITAAEEPVVVRVPVTVGKAPVQPNESVRVAGKLADKLVIIEKPSTTTPSVALQVAIFRKESQALRAQKKIMSKLNLPVEIIKQWDYYHVLVTGFYSREETYQYYPELAGLGYPGITLIENYRRQR